MEEKKISKDDYIELELDGHIYITHKNGEGEVLSREELDGELMLKALLSVIDQITSEPSKSAK